MATQEAVLSRVSKQINVGISAARGVLSRVVARRTPNREPPEALATKHVAAPPPAGQSDDAQIPVDSGLYGSAGKDASGDARPLCLALFGDSLAVGVGAGGRDHTVGARVAATVASATLRSVRMRNFAVAGSGSAGLAEQVAAALALERPPEVALIVVGGNDVLHRESISRCARHLYRAVLQLRAVGCRVVVATCPDLGSVRLAPRPLRYYLRRMSRRLAIAQTIVVVRAGGRPVPLLDTLGPIFLRKPKVMFSSDHFHPSALGYARAAALLAPSVLAATGHGGSADVPRSGAVRMPGR